MKAFLMAWNAYLFTAVIAKDFSIWSHFSEFFPTLPSLHSPCGNVGSLVDAPLPSQASQLEKDDRPSTSLNVSGKAAQAAPSAAVAKVCLIFKRRRSL